MQPDLFALPPADKPSQDEKSREQVKQILTGDYVNSKGEKIERVNF